jgi:hypothetical protein
MFATTLTPDEQRILLSALAAVDRDLRQNQANLSALEVARLREFLVLARPVAHAADFAEE